MTSEKLRFALPSKGRMMDDALQFMSASGLRVARPNPRQYTAFMRSIHGAQVIFQNVADIYPQVNAGTVDIGITGLDGYSEQRQDGDSTVLVLEDLGFGRCEVVVAVPDAWIDVGNVADLARLAAERSLEGRPLRVATHYGNLVSMFFRSHGIRDFVVESSFQGTLEMAPSLGTADLIADISETGTTIKENQLKVLSGGVILKSQACLIGNRTTLKDAVKLEAVRSVLELMEASLRAQEFYSLIANVSGDSPEAVAKHIVERPELAGLTGPTVSQVFPKSGGGHWYAVNVVVDHAHLVTAIDHLREIGATGIDAIPTKYVFEDRCRAYDLLAALVNA